MACCGCWRGLIDGLRRPRRRGRQIRRAKYNEREYSIEFENLIDEEDFTTPQRHVFSDQEKELAAQGKFDALFEQQRKFDAEIDEKLRKQEEDLRLEEEAFYQAKREVAKVNKQSKAKQQKQNHQVTIKETKSTTWSSGIGADTDSGDMDFEDFDAFLEKVKARSLSSKALTAEPDEDDGSFEAVLKLGVEATRQAGDATTALQPSFSDDEDEINILSTSPAIV